MKNFSKSFITFILLNLACVIVLSAAESVTRIYLTPGDSVPLLIAEGGRLEGMTEMKPIMDSELSEEGWMMGTWNGPLKGYVFEGSANKQLSLPAGTMVYMEPTLESTVITMVDTNDERNEIFRVVGTDQNWEVVEFQKPVRVYWRNQPETVQDEQLTEVALQVEESYVEDTTDMLNAVEPDYVVSHDSENTEHVDMNGVESGNQQLVSINEASQPLVEEAPMQESAQTLEPMQVVDANVGDDVFEGEVVQAVEMTDGSANTANYEGEVLVADVSEDASSAANDVVVEKKKVLPPVDKDPLVRRANPTAASSNRQLTGKLVKSSLLNTVMEKNNQYELRDSSNNTLAYLDLSGVNDVCHYLNRSVVVQGAVSCKRPSAPLTMKVKLIRIVR